MRKKLICLTLALAALAAAQAGIAPVSAAPPGCDTYLHPPSRDAHIALHVAQSVNPPWQLSLASCTILHRPTPAVAWGRASRFFDN